MSEKSNSPYSKKVLGDDIQISSNSCPPSSINSSPVKQNANQRHSKTTNFKNQYEDEASETEPPADPTPSAKLEPAPLPVVNPWFKQSGKI